MAMIWLMMNESTKPPIMLPSPPSTQIMNMTGPNVLPMNGCTSYCSTSRHAASPASAALIDPDEPDDVAILGDGADRRADIGPLEEEIERHRPDQTEGESDQPREADVDRGNLDDRQPHADIAEIGADHER